MTPSNISPIIQKHGKEQGPSFPSDCCWISSYLFTRDLEEVVFVSVSCSLTRLLARFSTRSHATLNAKQ